MQKRHAPLFYWEQAAGNVKEVWKNVKEGEWLLVN